MSPRSIINSAASIRDRLLHKSKETKRPFQEVLQYYAMERFLYRLSISQHAHKFFLKGALMFHTWHAADHRATMDIDLLARTMNTPENLEIICREICKISVPTDDGIAFLYNTVKAKVIQNEAEYEGVRIEFIGELDRAKISMQIDIGFGDSISPMPQELIYPTILGQPAPLLKGYSPESVIAEKLETMVKRGRLNSRMKDFFDIWTLSNQFSFDSIRLSIAIQTTFAQRNTQLTSSPECFSELFSADPGKITQWNSFLHKNSPKKHTLSLQQVTADISTFVAPILLGLTQNTLQPMTWNPADGWTITH